MIFIIFFGVIVLAVVGLNMVNSNNLYEIENYYASNRCEAVTYVRGEYKGLCKDSIVLIKNGFSVDVEKPDKVILYKDIQGIKKQDKMLVIMTHEMTQLEFKHDVQLVEFYNKVQSKK